MFRLAVACGRWDVDALLDEMTPEQWGEWIAYDRLEPIGEKRADLRHAMHLAHILRMLSAMAGGDPHSIDETNFLPFVPELHQRQEQHPRQVKMALQVIGQRFEQARRTR